MKKITIIENERKLFNFLKAMSLKVEKNYSYCAYEHLSPQAISALNEHNVKRLSNMKSDQKTQKQFIDEYLKLITKIDEGNPHRVWLASDMCSKNRYSSKLPDYIEDFLNTMKIVKASKDDHIILLYPSWCIVQSLIKEFDQQRISYAYMGSPLRQRIIVKALAVRKYAAVIFNILKIGCKSLYAKIVLKSQLQQIMQSNEPYYVIKTFIYNHSFKEGGDYKDVFFGKLVNYLKEKENIFILANCIDSYSFCVPAMKKTQSVKILPFEIFLTFKDIFNAWKEILFTNIECNNDMSFCGYDVKDIVQTTLSRTFKGVQVPQFLQYWSTKNLVRSASINTFLMTFENYPWERMCIKALKESDQSIKVVGYQHTVVPQAYLNYFISDEERETLPLPDKILTTGERPKQIMKTYSHYRDIPIEAGCGLRFEYLFEQQTAKINKEIKKVLIATEGVYDAFEMIQYVVDQLKNNPEYEVRIRTHKLLPWEKYVHRFGDPLKGVSNFKISEDIALKDEIAQVDVVIYWGTSVSLEALMMGKPVIHFDKGNILSFDPVFESSRFKWNVDQNTRLEGVFENIESMTDQQLEDERQAAKEYISQYFHPTSEENLAKFSA